MRVSDGSGTSSRDVDVVRIESLALGLASFRDVRAPVLGDGPADTTGTEPYGTLGFELFREYLLTLDYPQRQVLVATGELPEADGRTILNYSLESGTPHVDIDVAGQRMRASIDSGNAGGFILPLSFITKVPLRAPGRPAGKVGSALREYDLFRGDLAGDLAIGVFTFQQPAVFFSDLVNVPNIGRSIIRSFVVTFDQRHRRIHFTQP